MTSQSSLFNVMRRIISLWKEKGFLYIFMKIIRTVDATLSVFFTQRRIALIENWIRLMDFVQISVFSKKEVSDSSSSVSVVVCVHNALSDVQKCLASVELYSEGLTELVLVDDGSNQEVARYISQYESRHYVVHTLRNDHPERYTKAANKGMKKSTCDIIILLNSDTIVTKGWIQKIVRCANSSDRIGLVGPLSSTASWQSVPEVDAVGDWAHNDIPRGFTLASWANAIEASSRCLYPRIPFLNGFCFAIKRSVISDIGYFDETHFPAGYGEENDYCLRAADRGWRLAIADDTYVYHAESRSYSHKTRHELSKVGDNTLVELYGQKRMIESVLMCKYSPTLKAIRKRVKEISS